MQEENPAPAYWRTGRAFHGQLEQTCVILNEKGRLESRTKRENLESERSGTGDGYSRGRGGGRGGRGGRVRGGYGEGRRGGSGGGGGGGRGRVGSQGKK